MLLVPRQLQRAGMTGNVPYYGGRFSPAQAYAASHPSRPQPRPRAAAKSATSAASASATSATDPLQALQHLLDTGVITADEYRELRARVAG
jgi:hypothetical protein